MVDRFEYYSHDYNSIEGSVNLYRRVETGGDEYYPAADYEALETKLAALVEAAEKSNLTFYKMLHHFAGNLDYPKEYRKYIEQLSSELKAAVDAAKVKP